MDSNSLEAAPKSGSMESVDSAMRDDRHPPSWPKSTEEWTEPAEQAATEENRVRIPRSMEPCGRRQMHAPMLPLLLLDELGPLDDGSPECLALLDR